MEIHKIEVFSKATNLAVIRPPGRRFPGSVIQGDTLAGLVSSVLEIAKIAKQMEITDENFLAEIDYLEEMLFGRLVHYQGVLDEHDIKLPYNRRFTENDYIKLTPENNDDSNSEGEIIATGLTIDDAIKLFPIKRKNPDDPRASIKTTFHIYGSNLVESECTKAAGVAPTKFLEKRIVGRFVPSGKPNELPPAWTLEVCHEPSGDLNATVIELLNLLLPNSEIIMDFVSSGGFSAGFDTSIIMFDEKPDLSLSGEALRNLGVFGYSWYLEIQDVS